MSTTLREKFTSELDLYHASPESIMAVTLEALEEALNGELTIVDPTNPFMFLLEASATHAATAILKGEAVARKRYPLLATQYEELYHHMSDADYLDRFATPAKTVLTLVVPVSSIKSRAVVDAVANVKRLTLPKDTLFQVGLPWMIHYPINIQLATNDVIQVTYDLTPYTPLASADTNLLNYRTVGTATGDELVIDIPVEQINVESLTSPLSSATGFSATYAFSDQFYYLRAYWKGDEGEWTEMAVTHSDAVYDRTQPTMQVTVIDQAVKVMIPDIYVTEGRVGTQVRVDIFTTQGQIAVDLRDFSSGEFSGRWQDLNGDETPYSLALRNMNDLRLLALDPVVTGRDGLSFEALRERVIYRSADQRASITFRELTYQLRDRGYTVVVAKDTITERLYLCSRALPPPVGLGINTPIGVVHGMVAIDPSRTDYDDAVLVNGGRMTLTDRALFIQREGVVELATVSDLAALDALNEDLKIAEINRGVYFYTPFFYVLDMEQGVYKARAYYLDSPASVSRSFVDANRGVWFAISTRTITIVREDYNFVIRVQADIPNGLTGVRAQLIYTDVGNQQHRVTANVAEVDGKTALLEFRLASTLDIDASDRIEVNNMKGPGGNYTRVFMDLVSEFDLLYYKDSTLDAPTVFDHWVIPENTTPYVVATHERCTLKFGDTLEGLAVRTQATVTPPTYAHYEEDVAETYAADVYARDEDGKLVWTVDPDTNKPVFEKLHSAGDIVMVDGEPVMTHRAGDTVYDTSGKPVVLESERVTWSLEPVMLDARYRYATSAGAVAYRDAVGPTVLGYLDQDLRAIEPSLMARTELEYRPIASTGSALATVEGKQLVMLDTALEFKVHYLLTDIAYEDSALKAQLITATATALRDILYRDTFSMSELYRVLKSNSDYIVNVSVENPIDGYDVAVLRDKGKQFSLRTELYSRSNGTLDIRDAITVTFSR